MEEPAVWDDVKEQYIGFTKQRDEDGFEFDFSDEGIVSFMPAGGECCV